MLKDEKDYSTRGTNTPWYRGWDLSEDDRAVFRATTLASQEAKRRAASGQGGDPHHPIYKPRLNTKKLMPQLQPNGLRALSLFSGGGGLDIGFDRAGYTHVASYEIMDKAASVLKAARPSWNVHGGAEGDVTKIDWRPYRGLVDILHGGPPCQPFSHAGRRQGAGDVRDMIPELVRAVRAIQPTVFVCENVGGLLTSRFKAYVQQQILAPLQDLYTVRAFVLDALDFGVPQRRRRVFFVGFRDAEAFDRFSPPVSAASRVMGARQALGLPDIGIDAPAPTLRSGLTGPRHTTSILNSVSAQRVWEQLQIWPNGVAGSREHASAYVAKHGHFRLSVQDCMLLQGFPDDWPISGPVYLALGLIGNSVAPPMGYHLARSIARALKRSKP